MKIAKKHAIIIEIPFLFSYKANGKLSKSVFAVVSTSNGAFI